MLKKTKLNDDLVRAVSLMVINFQSLEFDVARLTWIMSGPNEYDAQLKTAGKRFSDLCDLLSTLFHDQVKVPSFVETFDNLISRIRTVNKDRNRIVHSWWFTDHVGEASRLKTAKDGHDDSEDIDVNALAFSIHTLIDDFAKFVDELHEAKLIRKKPGISLDSLR
jgi:hypothetical protein